MPDLPQIFAQPNTPYQGHIPQTTPNTYGANVFHTLGELADAMIQKQKPIDAARQSSIYDIGVQDLKNKLAADPDPNTWRQKFMQGEQELRKTLLDAIPDADVQKVLNIHADRQYGTNVNQVTELQIKASHAKQLGDIEQVGQTLAMTAGLSDDPAIRASATNTYNSLVTTAGAPSSVGGKSVPASLLPKEVEDKKQKFQLDMLRNRAKFLAEDNPWKLQAEYGRGDYQALPLDEQSRVLEGIRIGINNKESAKDKMAGRIHDVVKRTAEAQANFGLLSDAFLNAAMSGLDPYVKPEEGRALKAINDNPPTGEGSNNVRAIMSDYYSQPRSTQNIENARKRLNALQADLGRPNPLIMKANNELQSDQSVVENIDVQKQNHAITAAKDTYDATKPPMPSFLNNLLGNQDARNKAKIADAIRKGQDPKAAIEKGSKEQKRTLDSISNSNKKVMEIE